MNGPIDEGSAERPPGAHGETPEPSGEAGSGAGAEPPAGPERIRLRGGGEPVNWSWSDPVGRLRVKGTALVAAGILVIVWSTLSLAGAAYGSAPMTDVAERRSYNMVKVDTHRAWPVLFLRALAGLGIAIYGGALLSRAARVDGEGAEG